MWKNNVCSIMEEISLCVTVHGHIKGGPNNWSTFITLPTKQMASQEEEDKHTEAVVADTVHDEEHHEGQQ